MKRRQLLRIVLTTLITASIVAGSAFAEEFFGAITKVDADAKTITVVQKKSDKEVVVKVDDKTEYVTKKGAGKVDFEKLTKGIEKAKEKGGKGIFVKVEHEKKVASKITVVQKKAEAPKSEK